MANVKTRVKVSPQIVSPEGRDNEACTNLAQVVGTSTSVTSEPRRVLVPVAQNGAPMHVGAENLYKAVVPDTKHPRTLTAVDISAVSQPRESVQFSRMRPNVPGQSNVNGLHTVEGKSSHPLVKPPTPDDL